VTALAVGTGKTYRRQAIALLLIFLLTAVLFAVVGWFFARQHLNISSQSLYRDLAARIVEENHLLYADGAMVDPTAVKYTFDRYMSLNPALEIYQLDSDGNIVAFSAEKDVVKKQNVNMEPIVALIENQRPLPILGEDPRGSDRKKIFSATQLSDDHPELGYLYVILRGEAVDTIERTVGDTDLKQRLLLTMLLSLCGGLFTALLVFRWLGRPLESLTEKVASKVPLLQLHSSTDVSPGDEIETLESTFLSMSNRIRSQTREIHRQDHMRRRFIADISHDLRTPLAIVKSILESLQLRFSKLNEIERLDHIETARRQADLLSGLVTDLFQLARLENPTAPIVLESIHIGDLIQDVVHKHQLVCADSKIELVASVESDIPFILGHTELIERLLDNLITNAVQHIGAGGRIDVGLYRKKRAVCVSVADTGSGIEHVDRDRIFDPGYSGPSVAKQGTGLGLAIAKRIALLHKGDLALAPSIKGARFELVLPLAA